MNNQAAQSLYSAYIAVYEQEELTEEVDLEEVTGGGFIKPSGTKYATSAHTGYTSPSQQKGRERSQERRSSSVQGPEKVPTRGIWGEPTSPDGEESGLAMTPEKRMETRAKALSLRGQTKRANKIKAVMSRPPMKEEVDNYDIVLEHLLDEGYCDDAESAEVIMTNMSEEWRETILEGKKKVVNKLIKLGRDYAQAESDDQAHEHVKKAQKIISKK